MNLLITLFMLRTRQYNGKRALTFAQRKSVRVQVTKKYIFLKENATFTIDLCILYSFKFSEGFPDQKTASKISACTALTAASSTIPKQIYEYDYGFLVDDFTLTFLRDSGFLFKQKTQKKFCEIVTTWPCSSDFYRHLLDGRQNPHFRFTDAVRYRRQNLNNNF